MTPLSLALVAIIPIIAAFPSMLFTENEYKAVVGEAKAIKCKYDLVKPGRILTIVHPVYHVEDILSNMTNRASTPIAPKPFTGAALDVLGVEDKWEDNIPKLTSVKTNRLTLVVVPLKSATDFLCFEMFALSGMFSAFLPLDSETEQRLMRRNTQQAIETHFAMPIIMPDRILVDAFSDKVEFASWMMVNGFEAFIPATFTSVSDVKFPVVIKPAIGVSGVGSSIAENLKQLSKALEKQSIDSVIIQVGGTTSHFITTIHLQ